MVNPDVDGYFKTLNHQKILRKTQKDNLLKTKRLLISKYKLSGVPVFAFILAGGTIRSSDPRQLRHWTCHTFVWKTCESLPHESYGKSTYV